jgi:iron complex outermembrane receptor protein
VVLGVSGPLAGQDRPGPVSPDSAIAIPELTVEIGRLRTGSVPLAEVPFPVQIFGGTNLQGAAGSTVADALMGAPGITLTNQTGSASQADIRIRGFALSPIVGVPQGVSVFVDGVRVNEADASQVHLSLIPEGAVERIELIRGPVGAFGRNSLAGALNIVTRRGMDRAVDMEIEGGSFGLMKGTLGASGSLGSFDGFLSATHEEADGWRDLSATQERSLFAKVGRRGDRTDAWLSYTLASHTLGGPGPLPESWLNGGALPADINNPPEDHRRLQYTGGSGDTFIPRLHFFNGQIESRLGDRWTLQASSYGRLVDFSQSNDNITEPNALGLTDIRTLGATAQLSYEPTNGLIAAAGTEWTRNHVEIEIRELPNPAFPSIPEATTERLETDENNIGAFGEVWWRARPTLAVYGSLRFDYVELPVKDLLDPSGSGRNTFSQLSGGLGISKHINTAWSVFASFGRGFRAPVVLEVMCADPNDPCQLPFELGPDPPLKAVTSDTWQGGLRMAKARGNAEVAVYWSEVHNDIFNVTDLDTPTRGFFTNLDQTRRVGAEASLTLVPFANRTALTMNGTLGWTRATFESTALLSAPFIDDDDDPADPDDEDELTPPEVEPGDRFPMVPSLTGSLGVRYDTDQNVFQLNGSWVGRQFLVGDEGNEGTARRLPRYALLNARVERRLGDAWIYLRVSNLLDSDFLAYGVVSENLRGPNLDVERFLTPGQPRRFTAGVRVRLQG